MRIFLNTEKCQGHLRCMDLAPDLFDCDDLGYGVVRTTGPVPTTLEQAARHCAANCPERAISLR
ncbi:ferredoxin [Nocardia tenerifensis]|uniref:Ferredoxin n=1 Tax=Nocardia tenerifensis TaxID=228006 RepID=A0A318JQG3_9NOCA|nr:ferredoxin [Nocardia tenerifensis]PXX58031.1 ferredoxin [Nocardia tenerifensis]